MTRKPQNRKTGDAPERTARGFRRASDMSRGMVDRIASKHGFAVSDVLLNWTEIVGAEHAHKCRPVKVHYAAKSMGATLIVHADSGRAPEVEHLGPRIIERINQFYGYGAIRRLKVTQSTGMAPASGFAEDRAAFAGPETSPGRAERSMAATLTEGISSPGLKAALAEMGAHVLARGRKDTKSDGTA